MINEHYILEQLQAHQIELNEFGVVNVGLFGSYVRNEQKENSDIDLLIKFNESKENFDNFMNLCFYLDTLFEGKKVDVVTYNSLSPYIGKHILNETHYAFAS